MCTVTFYLYVYYLTIAKCKETWIKSIFLLCCSLDSRPQYASFPNVSEVTENLILCSAFCVNRKLLDTLNISCIINAALELPYLPPDNSSIKYHKVPIMDASSTDIYQHFDDVCDIIHEVRNSCKKCSLSKCFSPIHYFIVFVWYLVLIDSLF